MFTIPTSHSSTSEVQQVTVTGIVQSCGHVGHSTADTDERRTVGRFQTNLVCYRCQLKRRRSVTNPEGSNINPDDETEEEFSIESRSVDLSDPQSTLIKGSGPIESQARHQRLMSSNPSVTETSPYRGADTVEIIVAKNHYTAWFGSLKRGVSSGVTL
ncbi:hypothetical protein TNCV_1578191 [Trichonephila clavipes]|nr:hypothetical protein TNCV_1578191 [Trichonephila clavipes]